VVTTQKCLIRIRNADFLGVSSTVAKRLRVGNDPQGKVPVTLCSLFGLCFQADAGECFSVIKSQDLPVLVLQKRGRNVKFYSTEEIISSSFWPFLYHVVCLQIRKCVTCFKYGMFRAHCYFRNSWFPRDFFATLFKLLLGKEILIPTLLFFRKSVVAS